MAILDFMKGKTTITELMNMPNRIFHTLYHRHYLIAMSKDDKDKDKLQAGVLEDQLEEMSDGGML